MKNRARDDNGIVPAAGGAAAGHRSEGRPSKGASREVKIRSHRVDAAAAIFVPTPPELLGAEYTSRPVRIRSALGKARAHLLRRQTGEVVLVVNKGQWGLLQLDPDVEEVELWIEVIAETLRVTPPDDLVAALDSCLGNWEDLPERDRHLAIGLVKEAKTPDLRQARIRMICRSLQKTL